VGFSKEWDERYQENTNMSIWPWSDLVSLVMRNKPQKENFKVLELGCGAGANIPLFASLGANYYAVEGSKTIVKKLHQQYPQFKGNIVSGDFTKDIPDEKFDLIVDRSSLTHNDERAIIECIDMCYQRLENGGKFIGIDWFSTDYPEYKKGNEAGDVWTKTFKERHFADVGKVHFSDKAHLLELFKKFKILNMTHIKRVSHEEIPNIYQGVATWNFLAEKL
jgi:SAM-dependent methyltransferase